MSRVAVNEEDSGSNRRIDCGKENESNYRNGGGLGIASRGYRSTIVAVVTVG